MYIWKRRKIKVASEILRIIAFTCYHKTKKKQPICYMLKMKLWFNFHETPNITLQWEGITFFLVQISMQKSFACKYGPALNQFWCSMTSNIFQKVLSLSFFYVCIWLNCFLMWLQKPIVWGFLDTIKVSFRG